MILIKFLKPRIMKLEIDKFNLMIVRRRLIDIMILELSLVLK